MIDLGKLGHKPYRDYLISKALVKGLEAMEKEADPHEDRERVFIASIIDMEFPLYKAESHPDSKSAVKYLTNFMELIDIEADGTRIYRSNPNEDIHG